MNKNVVIIGASGHGKVIADIVCRSGDQLLGFLDDDRDISRCVAGIPVLGAVDCYMDYPDAEFIVAIGNAAIRQRIAARMSGVRWYTAIHPAAVISPLQTSIGEGSAVMANAVINPCATVGKHCIVNTGAIVEHDDAIGDFSHIAVGARLAGSVIVGAHCWIGIGAAISNNLSLCDHCTVGAGAAVIRNIEEPGIYVGVPARKVK